MGWAQAAPINYRDRSAARGGCETGSEFPTYVADVNGKTIYRVYFGQGQYEYTGSKCTEGERCAGFASGLMLAVDTEPVSGGKEIAPKNPKPSNADVLDHRQIIYARIFHLTAGLLLIPLPLDHASGVLGRFVCVGTLPLSLTHLCIGYSDSIYCIAAASINEKH